MPWRILRSLPALTICFLFASPLVHAQFTFEPLSSFGTNGWLAPGDDDDITTNNTQRGLAYNSVTDHLLMVDRDGSVTIKIFDGTTGADLGDMDTDTSIILGGTFTLNMIDIADDGVIYAANLQTNTDNGDYTIYRWENEAAAPTVAFEGVPTNGIDIRLGDTLAAIGSGTDTILLAGANNTSGGIEGDPGDNSFAIFTSTDGVSFAGEVQDFVGTEPETGTFRLGIDFIDTNTVIGREAGPPNQATMADFDAGTATVVATPGLLSGGEAPLGVERDKNLLATIDINGSDLRLYDISDPANSVFIDAFNVTTASEPNINGTGDISFGNNRAYALNTNNGIQAFEVIAVDSVTIGDMNGDDEVNFGDLSPFALGLTDVSAYEAAFPELAETRVQRGDVNEDEAFNFGDLSPFVDLLTAGGGLGNAAVPEPGTAFLLACGVAWWPWRRFR